MCSVVRALISCIKFFTHSQQMHFGFMNVILLHSDHRDVWTTCGQLQDGKYKNTNILCVGITAQCE
jgi:hypothetical protein